LAKRYTGTEGSAVQYSACCHPLPGDPIVGHLRGGHGLALHRQDCETATRQRVKDAERWIDVQWSDEVSGQFLCGLEVLVVDDRGVLGKVAAEISSSEANIVNVTMDAESDRTATLRFAVQVKDRVHLAQVMRNLRHLPEVRRITRT
jgi:GTP pyrophosphokinase